MNPLVVKDFFENVLKSALIEFGLDPNDPNDAIVIAAILYNMDETAINPYSAQRLLLLEVGRK